MNYINIIDLETNKYLSFLYNNNIIKIPLLIVLGLYIVVSPKLPNTVILLYNNMVFRFLVIYLIIFFSNRDIQLSVMIAVAYLFTIYKLDNTHLKNIKNI